MDQVIADGKVVLGMLAAAGLIYFVAYNFMKPRPKAEGVTAKRIISTLILIALGGVTGYYLSSWANAHGVSSAVTYQVSIFMILISLLYGCTRRKPVAAPIK